MLINLIFAACYSLLYFYTAVGQSPCLDYNAAADKCRSCSLLYYNSDPENSLNAVFAQTQCIEKTQTSTYNAKIIVTSMASPPSTSDYVIYSSLRAALESEEANLEQYPDSNLQIYLAKENHFIFPSDKITFFRRKNVQLSLSPFYCVQSSLTIPCYDYPQKPTVSIKTGLLFFFITKGLVVSNITFNGSDILVKPADRTKDCFLKTSCCSGADLQGCVTAASEDALDENNYGLFNIETFIESPTTTTVLINNCDFNEIYPFYSKSNFQSFVMAFDIPFDITIKNVSITNFHTKKGIFYLKKMSVDPLYDYLTEAVKTEYAKAFVYTNTKLLTNGTYMSGLGRYASSVNVIELISLTYIPSATSLTFGGLAINDFNFITNTQSKWLFNILQLQALKFVDFSVKASSNVPLFFVMSTTLEINNFTMTNVVYSLAQNPFTFTSSVLNITTGLVKSYANNFGNAFLFMSIAQSKINLGNLVVNSCTNFYISGSDSIFSIDKVELSTISIKSDMIVLYTSDIYIKDLTLTETSIATTSLNFLSGPNSNLYVSSCLVYKTSANYLFNIANTNGKVYVNNSIFKNFVYLYHLIGQNTVRIFVMNNVTFSNASINMFFYNTLNDEVSHPHHNLTNCLMENLLVTGTYFSKLFPQTVSFVDSVFRNITLKSNSSRSFYKIDICHMLIRNTTYINIGYMWDVSTMSKIYDRSVYTIYTGIEIIIDNATYLIDNTMSIRGGFLSIYTLETFANINNSVFKVTIQNPAFSYKALVFYLTPKVYVSNSQFYNFLCPTGVTTILHENAGAITVTGSLDYAQQKTDLITVVDNCKFFNNTCDSGGAFSTVNINMISMRNCFFQTSKAKVSGGHVSLLYGEGITIDSNTFDTSTTVNKGGALQISTFSSLSIKTSKFMNVASNSGGFIHCNFIVNIFVSDSSFIKSSSLGNAGALYFYKSQAIIQRVSFDNLVTGGLGGALYLSTNSSLMLSDINVKNSKGAEGGFVFVKDATKVIILNLEIVGSSSRSNGGAIYIGESPIFNATNIVILDSYSEKANGVIYLKEPTKCTYIIENLVCENNGAKYGSCIFAYSNSDFTFTNIIIRYCRGTALYFFSLDNTKLNITDFQLLENNLDRTDADLATSNFMFYLNVDLIMKSGRFRENKAESFINSFSSSKALFTEVVFINSGSYATSSVSLFETESSDIVITICEFKTNIDKFYSNLGVFQKSNLTITSSIFYDNKHDLEGLIVLQDSEVDINDCEFRNNTGKYSGVFYIESSDLTIQFCTFRKNHFSNFKIGSSENDVVSPQQKGANEIYGSNSNFNYNFTIILLSSELEINEGCSIKLLYLQNLILEQINMTKTTSLERPMGSGILLYDVEKTHLQSIIMSNFVGSKGASIIIENKNVKSDILMNYVSIFYSESLVAAGIYINTFDNLALRNILVYRNQVVKKLTSFTNISSLYEKIDSQTEEDSSLKGVGGVGIIECQDRDCIVTMANSSLIENMAEMYAPTFYTKVAFKELKNVSFISNEDKLKFTSGIYSYPLKLVFLPNISTKETPLDIILEEIPKVLNNISDIPIKIVSGSVFNLTIVVLDYYNQLLIYDNRSSATISSSADQQKINIENSVASCEFGVCFFLNLKINTNPNSKITLDIEVESENIPLSAWVSSDQASTTNMKNNISLKGFVRPCESGEVYKDDGSCSLCPETTYFLEDPMTKDLVNQKCQPCLKNAICLSGKNMIPLSGFWKTNPKSINIIECTTPVFCQGNRNVTNIKDIGLLSEDDLKTGACHPNHEGNLCFGCKKGFGKIGGNNDPCESCDSEKTSSLVKFCFIMTGFFLYIWYTVKVYASLLEKSNITSRVLLKILINQFQQNSLVTLLDFNWSLDIKDIFKVVKVLSFLTEDMLTTDCIFSDMNYNSHVLKVIFTIVLPIILSVVFFIVSLALSIIYYNFLKRKLEIGQNMRKVLLFFLVSIFILYPQIINMCFSLMNCMLLDEKSNLKVLRSAPMIECWTGDHYKWVASIACIGLLAWAICFPLGCLFLMKRYRTQIQNNLEKDERNHKMTIASVQTIKDGEKSDPSIMEATKPPSDEIVETVVGDEMVKLLSFLFKGYKKKYYYWEVVIFFKKLLITFLVNFSEFFPTKVKGVLLIIVFLVFITINIRFQPYYTTGLTNFDTASLIICTITANIGLFLYSQTLAQADKLFVIVIVCLNFGFFLIWLLTFLKSMSGGRVWLEKVFKVLTTKGRARQSIKTISK